MRTPRRSPSPRKRSLSAVTDSAAREMSATMTIANLPCTTVWLMSMMLQSASARICETAATMPGWSTPKTETMRRSAEPSARVAPGPCPPAPPSPSPVVLRAQLARRLDEFVGLGLGQVHAVDDADDGRLNRHLLVAEGRARRLPVGAQHDLARPGPEAVGDDDDVL